VGEKVLGRGGVCFKREVNIKESCKGAFSIKHDKNPNCGKEKPRGKRARVMEELWGFSPTKGWVSPDMEGTKQKYKEK